MNNLFYRLNFIIILLVGCSDPTGSGSDDVFPFEGKLKIDIRDSENHNKPTEINTYLFLKTVEEYPCANYILNTRIEYVTDLLIITIEDFLSLDPPTICATAFGPANAQIQLALTSEIQTLKIGNDNIWDKWRISVNLEGISLHPIDTTFTILLE